MIVQKNIKHNIKILSIINKSRYRYDLFDNLKNAKKIELFYL